MKSPKKSPVPIEETTLAGFAMSDEPFPGQEEPMEAVSQDAGVEDLGNPGDAPRHLPVANKGIPAGFEQPATRDGDIIEPSNVVYESRIHILEAFRYLGHFRDAPEWVDRNWLGHGDFDPLRKIEPGPALRVPLDSGIVLARIGDYVCKQSVTLAESVPPEVRMEVWPAETFQKLFLPRTKSSPPN